MNAPNENHEPTIVDDLHDRLVDRALSETLGNNSLPDLSPRIMAAAVSDRLKVELKSATAGRTRFRWLSLAIAATLLIGVATLLLSNGSPLRKVVWQTNSNQMSGELKQGTGTLTSDPNAKSNSGIVKLPTATKQLQQSVLEDQFVSKNELSADDSMQGDVSQPMAQSSPRGLSLPFRQDSFSIEQSSNVEESELADSANATVTESQQPLGKGYLAQLQGRLEVDAVDHGGPIASSNRTAAPLGKRSTELETIAIRERRQQLISADRGAMTERRLKAEGLFFSATPEGTGPDNPGDQYTRITENPFIVAEGGAAVSTFSIDVDTASYANVRQFLQQMNQLPPPDAVRIEELINYFDYDYAGPNSEDEAPFAAHVEIAGCPWQPEHRLVRIGIKGREMDRDKRPKSNLVFLVDVSGSMDEPNKLPLVVEGLQLLTRELGENDRVAIVVYASSEGLVLPSTRGDQQKTILEALGKLQAGGSTAGGAGIQLAYQIAEDNFIEGGTNRVILCTDGDFNVGVTSTAELERLCEQKAKDTKVFLSVLGFGRGNLNDAMMEAISNRGNGNYAYVDNRTEARRVLVNEMTGTLVTIAKDVKIQVEFNPQKVAGYRLIGYENRMLRTEDFNDDKKDAGEIGAGHTVTALYEIVPAGAKVDVTPVDDLKYQQPVGRTILSVEEEKNKTDENEVETDTIVRPTDNELLTLKMRYKAPEGDTSQKLEWPITDEGNAFSAATPDFQFATAAASFGLMLRDSQYKGNLTYGAVLEVAQSALGEDKDGYRAEFVELVRKTKELRHE